MKLSNQQQQVYDYLRENPGCTVRAMHEHIFPGVDKVSARLSELKNKGVQIKKLGRNQYNEMQYAIEKLLTKREQSVVIKNGVTYISYKEIQA